MNEINASPFGVFLESHSDAQHPVSSAIRGNPAASGYADAYLNDPQQRGNPSAGKSGRYRRPGDGYVIKCKWAHEEISRDDGLPPCAPENIDNFEMLIGFLKAVQAKLKKVPRMLFIVDQISFVVNLMKDMRDHDPDLVRAAIHKMYEYWEKGELSLTDWKQLDSFRRENLHDAMLKRTLEQAKLAQEQAAAAAQMNRGQSASLGRGSFRGGFRGGSRGAPRFQRGQGSSTYPRVCFNRNKGKCQFSEDHVLRNIDWKHCCAFCWFQRSGAIERHRLPLQRRKESCRE